MHHCYYFFYCFIIHTILKSFAIPKGTANMQVALHSHQVRADPLVADLQGGFLHPYIDAHFDINHL
jgi:hypothetical protein